MIIHTPYRVCPLGAHIDHQHGVVTGFAIDRGVTLDYEPVTDGSTHLVSVNYAGVADFTMTDGLDREHMWGDFARAAVVALQRNYTLTKGIKGTVSGTLPVGGLSSSASVILSYLQAYCRVNDIHLLRPELVRNALWAENHYIGIGVGKLDPSCEVYCKKDHLLVLDTATDETQLIPVNPAMPDFEIMVLFSGRERSLGGTAYNTRVDECKSAAYACMAFEGMEYGKYQEAFLRDVPYAVYAEHRERLPIPWRRRADHFYGEQKRVRDGIKAWRIGDLAEFGKNMFESGRSSIDLYEVGSAELAALHEIMEETPGVYGGRFSGAGFNGSAVGLVDPLRKEEISVHITERYLKQFPEMKGRFEINFCRTADGVNV